jgi:transposase
MLKAIIAGEQDSQKLAEMSRGLPRRKIPQLQQALEGRVSDHHRFLLRELMEHWEFIESKMRRLEQEIEERLRPFEETVERLRTEPGIDRVSAWGIISEIGLDMEQFSDEAHPASWAGLCPGNWESAGKRKSGRIRKGNVWLRRHLCQSAWGVSTKQNNYLSALFRRLAARRVVKRATIAVAHALLGIVYHILRRPVVYHELGPDYFDKLNPRRSQRKLVKRLEALGFRVTLEALPQSA